MGKKLARKRVGPVESTAPASTGRRCPRCERDLPRDAFETSPTLIGRLRAWCHECSATRADGGPDVRRAHGKDYMREYMRARRRREGPGTASATIGVDDGRGTIRAKWSRPRSEIRITGRWALHEDARRILVRAFGVAERDVFEVGRGGGTGARRHKTFTSTGPAMESAWNRGLGILRDAGMLKK